MKKILTLFIASIVVISMAAQSGPEDYARTSVAKGSWYKSDAESGIYGIDLEGAKRLVKDRKIKKTPIVALIGNGIDAEHEALKESLWFNPKEKPDGIDNDNNGYIDDINGWNFIGSKDGTTMDYTTKEGIREWLRLKDKYGDLFFDGEKFFKYVDGKRQYLTTPVDMKEYQYYFNLILSNEAHVAKTYAGYVTAFMFKEYVEKWDKEITERFSNKQKCEISLDDFKKFMTEKNIENDSLQNIAYSFSYWYGSMVKGYMKDKTVDSTWNMIYRNFTNKQIPLSLKNFQTEFNTTAIDNRVTIVGDNPNDINDFKYGNNSLLTSASMSGTMNSGIIAGRDVNNTGFSGIFPEAKLMTLVTNAVNGEPYVKDLALAIKYAVSNGADIILLPYQLSFIPADKMDWIYEAIGEAEKRGILVIVPVWEAGEDLAVKKYYPSRDSYKGKSFKNIMTVANSDSLGLPSQISNYGKEGLDTYAPGNLIYSTLPGDIYKIASSSTFGAIVAAGSAAFIKAYFPELSGADIRELLLKNCTDRSGLEVEKSIRQGEKIEKELFLFEQLCESAGILNLKKSVEAALKYKVKK